MEEYQIGEEIYSIDKINITLKGLILKYIALEGLNFVKISLDNNKLLDYLKEKQNEMCKIINIDIKKILIYFNEFEEEGIFLRYSDDIYLLHKKPHFLILESSIQKSKIVISKDFLQIKNSEVIDSSIGEQNKDDEYIDLIPVSIEIRDSVIQKSFTQQFEGDNRLTITPEISHEYVKNTIGQLEFTVVNTGKQIAKKIRLDLIGPIEVIGKTTLNELKPGKKYIFKIGIKPSEVGKIPIIHKLNCIDPEGNENSYESDCWIKVKEIKSEDIRKKLMSVQRMVSNDTENELINRCPFCGHELVFPKSPKFCPFCREQIRFDGIT